MITKKNYFSVVCILFTCIVLFKIILEKLVLHEVDAYYTENIITIFILSAIVVALFAVAPKLSGVPLWAVLLLGYFCISGVLMFSTWISHFWSELALHAYRDELRSFTIVYIPVAVIYYLKMYRDIKKANENLDKIQRMVQQDIYPK
jgi:hypothetical protein